MVFSVSESNGLIYLVGMPHGTPHFKVPTPTMANVPLRANYALERRHRVFWKGDEDNKRHFGIRDAHPQPP